MEGKDVVTSDDHKLGTVVAVREGCAIVETGHVFKTKHAIPTEFLHEYDGLLRATVGKEIFDDSPKLDGDDFDPNAVKLHYGLIEVHVVGPDPEELNAETDDPRRGQDPAERLRTLGGANDPSIENPVGGHGADSGTFGGHVRTTEAPDPRADWVDDKP